MAVKRGQILELDIGTLAFGGRGLAKVDGFAVFVDKTVPGDRIRARVFRKKKNHAEARLVEIITPSAMRTVAPCPYHGICGGCPWQFLPYDKQLQFKRDHVVESLEHIGGLTGIVVPPSSPCSTLYGYRNKMEFSFSDKRWLLPEELGPKELEPKELEKDMGAQEVALGLHVPGTYFKVLDIEACLLQPEVGNAILADVRDYVKASGIPVYGLKTHQGFWRFLMLRHSLRYDTWMVNLVTSDGPSTWVKPLADHLASTYPSVRSVVHNVNTRQAAIAVGEKETLLAGEPNLIDCIGPLEFEISANSFFQTNTAGAAILYDVVKKYARLTGKETVLDLYCGTGTISICLSRNASKVTGIEISQSAVQDAIRNCRRNHIENCRFICGDIVDVITGIREKPDVLVIDPPRAGMHQKVVEAVAAMATERIVYVSCNPTTLARDLSLLSGRYRIMEVQPVDMFPHTFHIECVANLERIG